MTPETQLDLFGHFAPAPGVHKSAPPADLTFARSPRARHYRLTLKRDGTAVVTIPARGSEHEARRFAAEHTAWLARARARQEKRPRSAATWTIGTQIPWRGEMTTIHVAPTSTPERPAVTLAESRSGRPDRFSDNELPHAVPIETKAAGTSASTPPAPIRVPSLTADLRPTLESYFLRVAKIELPARTWELATQTRVPVTEVTVRNQRTRWGSCTTEGVISLNWRLVQAPDFVRDYIIYHELMHLREMNHSPRFWARVAEVCPYWQDAERWIKQNGGLLGL